MYELGDLSAGHLNAIRRYPGLIAVLVYAPTAKVFEAKFKEAYVQMHVSSGNSLVIVGGRGNWVSPEERLRMRRDVRSRTEPVMGYVVALHDADQFEAAHQMRSLAERYGLSAGDLPSIIFISAIDGVDGYVFPLDRSVISAQTDHMMHDFEEMFEIVGKLIKEDPCPEGIGFSEERYPELVQWRASTIERVRPSLERLRLFKAARKIAPALLPAAARGLIGLA